MLHYKNLQLYLRLGLRIKLHCVLKLDQLIWLKPYTKKNRRREEWWQK